MRDKILWEDPMYTGRPRKWWQWGLKRHDRNNEELRRDFWSNGEGQ